MMLWAAIGLSALAALFGLLAWARQGRSNGLDPHLAQVLQGQERLEQVWRSEQAESQRQLRTEMNESARSLRMELSAADAEFRAAVARDAAAGRTESAEALSRFAMGFSAQLQTLIETNDRRLAELRGVVEERLQHLQKDNGARLEEMRRTVDEKLHATLEQRLGESFKLVSERGDAVHKGLGGG